MSTVRSQASETRLLDLFQVWISRVLRIMSNRKLNYNRLLSIISIPVVLMLISLIGWGISHTPAKEGFWLINNVPAILSYFFIGLVMVSALLLIILITVFITQGIYCLVDWIYPRQEDKSKEQESTR